MLARPSTSSGPGSASSFSSFSRTGGTKTGFVDNKRLSKDDLALTTARWNRGPGSHRTHGTAAETFWLPTPEQSPQRAPARISPSHARTMVMSPPAMSPPLARLPTPQSSSASGKIPIGMALGSPTRDSSSYAGSPQAGWQPQFPSSQGPVGPVAQSASVHVTHSASPLATPAPVTIQRTKTQKRRLFGSLFGSKKHAEPARVVESVASSVATPAPSRSNTVAGRKTPKHKPIIIKGMPEPGMSAPAPFLSPGNTSTTTNTTTSTSSNGTSTGLLNVDIPDIRLERYSVMFSGVLHPGSGNRSSSLLERRQATLERLKTISDRIEMEESEGAAATGTGTEEGKAGRPRRATSPHPAGSPSFPQQIVGKDMELSTAATAASLAPPSRGLARSNTSPGYLPSPSPSRTSFEPRPVQGSGDALTKREGGKRRKEGKTVTVVSPREMDERNRAVYVERWREQARLQSQSQSQVHSQSQHIQGQQSNAIQPIQHAHPFRSHPPGTGYSAPTPSTATESAHFHPNESSLHLDTPESGTPSSRPSTSAGDEPVAAPKPAVLSPHWEMITPPSSTSSSPPSSKTADAATGAVSNAPIAATASNAPRHPHRSPTTFQPTPLESPILTPGVTPQGPARETSALAPGTTAPRVSVDEADAALKAAVESSIARQISVSRQQRQLLRPFGGSVRGYGQSTPRGNGNGNTLESSIRSTFGSGSGSGSSGRARSATTGTGLGPAPGTRRSVEDGTEGEEVIKGVRRVNTPPVMVVMRAGDRRSERVVLDVVE
ncbi:uncharacterized protein C8A04DRAFT_9454 [Dichotomopilus funicola]|uniref:Uncharacterized protein n=1 Tax=Dichotomopilus funicola TaxID=1934379 RepID=A0AAN6V8T8_9PEZI|nr:hypothetical protein C8A04DRAFT_9454 [Dichotomopilus funicola]